MYGNRLYPDSPYNPHLSSVNWSYTGPLDYINGDIHKAHFRAGRIGGQGFIYAYGTNQCGSVENRMYYKVNIFFKAYPNPASDMLNIEFDIVNSADRLNPDRIEIRLYDKLMTLLMVKKTKPENVILNLDGLKPDVYILQIEINNEKFQETIIIQHDE